MPTRPLPLALDHAPFPRSFSHSRTRTATWALTVVLAALVGGPAAAVDGLIEINQAQALAGSVTPGDSPGFPVILTQPGSYRLTGSLEVPDGTTTAILVAAGDVAIDLNGFSIQCADPCLGSTGRGIDTVAAIENIRVSVRNGTIRNMGGGGVHLLARGSAEDLTVANNGGSGIFAFDDMHVRRCIVSENAAEGIRVSANSIVEANTVNSNGGVGIFAEFGSTISNNAITDNAGDGVSCGNYCNVSRNTILRNAEGIVGNGLYSGNTVALNTGLGLSTSGGSGLDGNIFVDNNLPSGPQISGGNEIGGNVCTGGSAGGLGPACP